MPHLPGSGVPYRHLPDLRAVPRIPLRARPHLLRLDCADAACAAPQGCRLVGFAAFGEDRTYDQAHLSRPRRVRKTARPLLQGNRCRVHRVQLVLRKVVCCPSVGSVTQVRCSLGVRSRGVRAFRVGASPLAAHRRRTTAPGRPCRGWDACAGVSCLRQVPPQARAGALPPRRSEFRRGRRLAPLSRR